MKHDTALRLIQADTYMPLPSNQAAYLKSFLRHMRYSIMLPLTSGSRALIMRALASVSLAAHFLSKP